MHIMNATILSGGCLELMPGFDLDRVLAVMKAGRVTKFFSVPTIYVRLLTLDRLKETMGDVRYCFSAAASMAAETVHQWKERTGLSIYEGYGMTEAAPTVAYNHQHRHVIGSVGTEVPGVEIQIRDENGNVLEPNSTGEVCVRGPNIIGYRQEPRRRSTHMLVRVLQGRDEESHSRGGPVASAHSVRSCVRWSHLR